MKAKIKKIKRRLNKMIDDLYNVGVDISYFPKTAERILALTAKQIAQETGEK